jgi:hypothetical protein
MRARSGLSRRLVAWVPLALFGVLAAVIITTSGPGRATYVIALDRISLGAAAPWLPALSPEAAIRRVASVFQDDLAMPLPDRITLRLYASPRDLERGLVEDAGVAPGLATELGSFAAGVSFAHELLLLEPESRRGARAWLRLVAHELAHVSQIELARGEGRASQWMAEGMAEWVAGSVLDRMGLAMEASSESALVDAVRAHLRGLDAPLDLGRLDEPAAFYQYGRREGIAAAYQLSQVLVDRLVERHGLPRVLAYFRAFARDPDREANFRHAFGVGRGQFAREFLGP